MKRYCKNKDINRIVHEVIKHGWRIHHGKKHAVLVAPNGKKLPNPSTPSDYRAKQNFSRDLRFIQYQQGEFCA